MLILMKNLLNQPNLPPNLPPNDRLRRADSLFLPSCVRVVFLLGRVSDCEELSGGCSLGISMLHIGVSISQFSCRLILMIMKPKIYPFINSE